MCGTWLSEKDESELLVCSGCFPLVGSSWIVVPTLPGLLEKSQVSFRTLRFAFAELLYSALQPCYKTRKKMFCPLVSSTS